MTTDERAPDILVWVIAETLSDGSRVFNLDMDLGEVYAISERDALDMAEKIADAIAQHSTQTAGVMT